MDNYSYSSYADSRGSSPRSCENPSCDDPSSNINAGNVPHNYKVKFMCSYGGKIHPRPHDNQLTYTGGDTKILTVDRNISFSTLSSRLSSLCDVTVCLKYQLPGEDLDALISVTNDEDLEHMMLEYDRLYRVLKPARLRLFLFPLNPPASTILGSWDTKSDRQWFVDALNSSRTQPLEDSSPPVDATASASNPDFLFGFDHGYRLVPGSDLKDSTAIDTVSTTAVYSVSAGSDCGSEDRQVVGGPVVSPLEFQDLQRLQMMTERKSNETNSKTSAGNSQPPPQVTEKIAPPPAAVPPPVQMPVPAAYFPERQMISGGFPVANAPPIDQSVYIIPTAGGLFQAQTLRPINRPVGHQPYYGMHAAYHEAQVHSSMAPQASLQQPNVGVYTSEGFQMIQPKIAVNEAGYAQMAYDNTARHVYFTTSPPYQTMAPVAANGRPSGGGGGSYNPEGNTINPSKASGL
ncbi:hypothetical protein SDJN03_18047, partial [Cucurbita argyrosperma subsp. sororia]